MLGVVNTFDYTLKVYIQGNMNIYLITHPKRGEYLSHVKGGRRHFHTEARQKDASPYVRGKAETVGRSMYRRTSSGDKKRF